MKTSSTSAVAGHRGETVFLLMSAGMTLPGIRRCRSCGAGVLRGLKMCQSCGQPVSLSRCR